MLSDEVASGNVHIVVILKRLLTAIAVGLGVLFASKAREQHWSETPSVLVDEARAEDESSDN